MPEAATHAGRNAETKRTRQWRTQTENDAQPPQLDAECPDIIDILKRLEFRNSFGILRLDKHCRDYFITTIQARHSAK